MPTFPDNPPIGTIVDDRWEWDGYKWSAIPISNPAGPAGNAGGQGPGGSTGPAGVFIDGGVQNVDVTFTAGIIELADANHSLRWDAASGAEAYFVGNGLGTNVRVWHEGYNAINDMIPASVGGFIQNFRLGTRQGPVTSSGIYNPGIPATGWVGGAVAGHSSFMRGLYWRQLQRQVNGAWYNAL